MEQTIKLRIEKIFAETKNTKTFSLQPVDNQLITYKTGQFLTFVFRENQKEIRRSYSISSSPEWDAVLAITIKRVDNGIVSRYLHDHAQVGDILESMPPTGRFILSENNKKQARDYFFITAGSGITPCWALIKTLLKTDEKARITLIYQTKNKENTIFYDEIEKISKNTVEERNPVNSGKGVKVIYCFSQPTDKSIPFHLNKDHLEQFIHQNSHFKRENAQFYLCGPLPYMRMAVMTLHMLDVQDEQIFREDFVIQQPFNEVELKDFGKPTDLTLHYKNQTYYLKVPYRQTLLDAALKAGIELPYSCKGGACTSCICQTVQGKVVMPSNYKLFESEILRGVTLSCIAYADSEVVEIEVK
jgi:ring-1,2-phenylacetyl-CoA epoxidase subunit PaaE